MITYEYDEINDDIIVVYGFVLDPTPRLRSYMCCTHVLATVALAHTCTGKEHGIVVPQTRV